MLENGGLYWVGGIELYEKCWRSGMPILHTLKMREKMWLEIIDLETIDEP